MESDEALQPGDSAESMEGWRVWTWQLKEVRRRKVNSLVRQAQLGNHKTRIARSGALHV